MGSIAVYYNHIAGFLPFNHEYLVYTDDEGNQFFVRGGPSIGISGTITITSGNYTSGSIDYVTPPDPRYFTVVATGSDAVLSSVWTNILSDANNIGSQNYSYYFLGTNSNTVIHTLLADAGLSAPIDDNEILEPGESLTLGSVSSAWSTELTTLDNDLGAAVTDIENQFSTGLANVATYLQNAEYDITEGYAAVAGYFEGLTGQGLTSTTNADGAVTYSYTDPDTSATATATFDSAGDLIGATGTRNGNTFTDTFDTDGDITAESLDYANGTSSVETFNSDGSTTTTYYSSTDGTGTVTGADQENPDGTSVITTYNTTTGSHTITSYDGPSGNGNVTGIDQENSDGTSAITNFDPTTHNPTTTYYSGPNGTGSVTGTGTATQNSDGSETLHFSSAASSMDVEISPTAIDFGVGRSGNGYFYGGTFYQYNSGGAEQYIAVTYLDGTTTASGSLFAGIATGYDSGNFYTPNNGYTVSSTNNWGFYVTQELQNSGTFSESIPVMVSAYMPDLNAYETQTVNLTASDTLYTTAQGVVENGDSDGIYLSVMHVGDNANQDVEVQNTATAGALNDVLNSSVTLVDAYGLSVGSDTVENLAPGATGTITLDIDTSTAGHVTGYVNPGLTSHDSAQADVAAPTNIGEMQGSNYVIGVNAYVFNYAEAAFANVGGVGTLTQSGNAWTLNLGTVQQTSDAGAEVGVENTAPNSQWSDYLNGSFATSGSGFTVSGADPFTYLYAGMGYEGLGIAPDTSTAGTNSETITLTPTSMDDYGFAGLTLPTQTLTITDTVQESQYSLAAGDGTVNIDNGATGGTAANGELDFGSGIATDQLWFAQSGNNLVVDLMGTSDQAVIQGWYSGTAADQLSEFVTSGGMKLDSALNSLVQAMATFSADNTGFDPTSTANTTVPGDTTLQAALAAAWHS
jgi:hypothetical protein